MKLLNNDNNNEKLDEVLIQDEKEIIQNNNINEKEKKDEIINFSFENINLFDKVKIQTIKNKHLTKKLFCYMCKDYTFINKLYKSKDDIEHKF